MRLFHQFRSKPPKLELNKIYQISDLEYFMAMISKEDSDFQVKRLKISTEDLSDTNYQPRLKKGILPFNNGDLVEFMGNDDKNRPSFRFAYCHGYRDIVFSLDAAHDLPARRLGLEKYTHPNDKALTPHQDLPSP